MTIKQLIAACLTSMATMALCTVPALASQKSPDMLSIGMQSPLLIAQATDGSTTSTDGSSSSDGSSTGTDSSGTTTTDPGTTGTGTDNSCSGEDTNCGGSPSEPPSSD